MTALSEFPDLYELPADPEARRAWRIEHDGQAAWAMRKVRDAALHRRRIEMTAEEEIRRIEQWVAQQCREVDRECEQFEAYLADYAIRMRDASAGDVKSVSTPWGRVQTRTSQARWEQDEMAALEWARRARPELVQTVDRFDLTAAKSLLEVTDSGAVVDPATGEVVEALTATPGRVRAYVQPDLSGGDL